MSRVAVVILNYNGENLLRQYLPSVVKYSDDADIIVADNGSADHSLAVLKNEFPGIQVIALPANYGFCGGYNRALQQVKADYYVLLNSDIEVTPGWLTPMREAMEHDKMIGAIQPKILSHRNRDEFEYAGAGGGYIDFLGYPFCRGRIFNTVEKDMHQYDDQQQIFWSSGACMMIRSSLYHRFGGLDEAFFAHMEEIDLCWRIQRAGYTISYTGHSTVYHLGAGTLGYGTSRKTYLNFRNGLMMIAKHFNTAELLWKFPLRIAFDWLAAAMFLVKGEPTHMAAVFKAHYSFVRSMPELRDKRREIRTHYPTYPVTCIYPGLILLQFFLFGKRKIAWPRT
jgi:GT2 family glycosyltransferase